MSAMKTRRINAKQTLLVLAALLWAFTGCQPNEEDPQPESSTVRTDAPTNVDFTSATFGGSVTKLGTGGVTDHGFVWGETTDPDLTATGKQSFGTKAETGLFTHDVTGLTAGVTYHVRAYVTDAQGTVYGENRTFSTTNDPTITSFTPTEGGQNDTLTITGTNFGTTTTDITVKFGSISATTVVSVSDTEIKAIVPSGVTEGANKITVMVKTQEVVSASDFTYLGGLWTQKADFGGVARVTTVSFTVGTKAYIGLGRTGNGFTTNTDDLWEYDSAADTWTQKMSYAGGKRAASVSFVIQDVAFVGLGTDETGTVKKDFWQYKPSTNTWSQLTDFAGTTSFADQLAFAVGSKGYVAKTNSTNLWEFSLGVWTQKNPLPASNLRNQVVVNDIAYVISEDNKVWRYDAPSDTWTALQDVPGTIFNKGVEVNGKAYFGGTISNDYVVWEYDPSTNTWAKKRGLLGLVSSPRYSEEFAINNKVYFREGDFRRTSFWEFDPSK